MLVMVRITKLAFVLILLLSRQVQANDFDQLCKLFEGFTHDKQFLKADSAARVAIVDKALAIDFPNGSPVIDTWNGVQNALPEFRYELIQDAAFSLNHRTFECAALKMLIVNTGYN